MPGELRASQRPHAADRCQARNPSTCKFHGSTPDAAVNRGDVNAFIDAKQSEDKNAKTTGGDVEVEGDITYAIFVSPSGRVYKKTYDSYGGSYGNGTDVPEGDRQKYLAKAEKLAPGLVGKNTKKEDRSNPPGSLKIEEGDGYAIFMTSDGKFYEKQYDRYGAGVGSRKISGIFTGSMKKAAKAQIAEAWAFHDKMEAQRIAAEERDSE